MKRAGRKRKSGQRWANGNLKKPSAAARNRTVQELKDLEKEVVLAQPHRRGRDQDQLLESALGRLVVRHKLQRGIYVAAVEWGMFMRRWLVIKGVPTEIHISGKSGKWPSAETVRRWDREVFRIENALKQVSPKGFEAMRTLIIAEREIDLDDDGLTCEWPPHVVLVLHKLASMTHNLPRNPQFFVGKAANTA